MTLLAKALPRFLLGVILLGALIFLPAGTLNFPEGWRLMGALFLPMFLAGAVMLRRSPRLLESRLNARESQKEQRLVIKLSGLMFLVGFVLAGLDFRFGWLILPEWVSDAGTAVFLGAYALYGEVLRENAWLFRTVQVQEGQRVVDSGLYGVVRHPMYAATMLLFSAMPLVLGSVISLVVFLAYPLIIADRIRHEEAYLLAHLPGYAEYMGKVKYRLIPGVW